MHRILLCLSLIAVAVPSAGAADLAFKQRLLKDLVAQVPGVLKSFDPKTGRFGRGIWICGDQQAMYPLAAAYASSGPGNRYYKDARLLETIIKAGDALIDDMNDQGQWMFRKKDGSTWGMIRMPWTYSRWIRTYQLIREDMPPERRERWVKALSLGYSKIAQHDMGHVHNIPAHHAMGLYAAGKALGRPEWCAKAADFLAKVAGQQTDGGYWSEGVGPVVQYGFVYVDALGTYYAMSGDRRVLPVLEKTAAFHRHFTYPSGQSVETVDQRNPYHDHIAQGNVGFTFTPAGRAYLQNQWANLKSARLDPDLIASLLLYGEEGPVEAAASGSADATFVLREGGVDRAATLRKGPWTVCLSAFTSPVSTSRWIQDRQNLVSIHHAKTGLILGGGNTKLQPGWSNFTVGNPALLTHRAGDTNPKFLPLGKLFHVPSAAKLTPGPEPSLSLTYGPETCRIRIVPKSDRVLEYVIAGTVESNLPTAAHLTLIPHLGKALQTAAGRKLVLRTEPIALEAEKIGGWIEHGSCRLRLPRGATVQWPVLPHNPYRADGRATVDEGRLVVHIPLDRDHRECSVTMEIR
jgi:hypothetical protein